MKKWIGWGALVWCVAVMGNNLEEEYLTTSHRAYQYEGEHLKSVIVDNLQELGKLTALKFIQYIKEHPEGVIALPTGKTPELFIKYLQYYKKNGVNGAPFPDTSQLKFVQLDEFYPLDPAQENSFTSFVKKHYLSLFNLAPENILTMDDLMGPTLKKHGIEAVFPEGKANLNLLSRKPKNKLESLQKAALEEAVSFCQSYEEKIQAWGGIGFFLGGIGPDGHVAFNLPGSLHDSKTRLIPLNYETAAASAGDLGGIERAQGKLAATIGLATICTNPEATVVIFAAGEGKASIIAKSIESVPTIRLPATCLQKMEGARFYLTKGAARDLKQRKFLDYVQDKKMVVADEFIDETLVEISLKKEKPLLNLTKKDLTSTPSGKFLSERFGKQWVDLKQKTYDRITASLVKGLKTEPRGTMLHTGPHHDDILLSYHPLAKDPKNKNYYVCLTSGFNSVTNQFAKSAFDRLKLDFPSLKEGLKNPYGVVLSLFCKAFKGGHPEQKRQADDLILAKKLEEQFGLSAEELGKTASSISDEIAHLMPGAKEPPSIQMAKGLIREAEEDRVWALSGAKASDVIHLRSKFYTGDFFTPDISMENDARPFQRLLQTLEPDLVTVALDPEGTGPSTHYKVLQIIATALRLEGMEKEPKVWGYRNVWDRFRFSEANFIAPVSEAELEELHKTFLECYGSQREASFPSPAFNGPFSAFVLEILAKQKKELEILLGENFFENHSDERVRNCAGVILLKEMTVAELVREAGLLRSKIEQISD